MSKKEAATVPSFTKSSIISATMTASSASTKTPFLIDDILYPNSDKCPETRSGNNNNNNSAVCVDNNNSETNSELSTNKRNTSNSSDVLHSNGLYGSGGGNNGSDDEYRKIIQSDRYSKFTKCPCRLHCYRTFRKSFYFKIEINCICFGFYLNF